jgi:hypothetical protein
VVHDAVCEVERLNVIAFAIDFGGEVRDIRGRPQIR